MNVPAPLNADSTVLVAIDFQERLFPVMHDKEKLLRNVVKLVRGFGALELPVVLTEQYPKGPPLPATGKFIACFTAGFLIV